MLRLYVLFLKASSKFPPHSYLFSRPAEGKERGKDVSSILDEWWGKSWKCLLFFPHGLPLSLGPLLFSSFLITSFPIPFTLLSLTQPSFFFFPFCSDLSLHPWFSLFFLSLTRRLTRATIDQYVLITINSINLKNISCVQNYYF